MIYEDLKDKRVLVTGSSSGIGAAGLSYVSLNFVFCMVTS